MPPPSDKYSWCEQDKEKVGGSAREPSLGLDHQPRYAAAILQIG
jgi:hypothetical protein